MGLATTIAPTLDAWPWHPVVSGGVFAGVMAAAAANLRHHRPFARLGLANHVTVARAVGVALVAGLIVAPATALAAWLAIGVSTVVALFDGVDGWLARRTGMASAFGARFDMETDALLILVLSILVWQHDKAGAWVLTAGLMRYAFIAAGRVWPWLAAPLRSTMRGKTVAVIMMAALLVALGPIVPRPMSASVAGMAVLTLAWSFTVDVRWLFDRRGREA